MPRRRHAAGARAVPAGAVRAVESVDGRTVRPGGRAAGRRHRAGSPGTRRCRARSTRRSATRRRRARSTVRAPARGGRRRARSRTVAPSADWCAPAGRSAAELRRPGCRARRRRPAAGSTLRNTAALATRRRSAATSPPGTSLVGAHLLVDARGRAFVSLLDPPDWAPPAAAAGCANTAAGRCCRRCRRATRCWSSPIDPAGPPGRRAGEPGRPVRRDRDRRDPHACACMTLTEEEKAEARGTDPRAAAIIDALRHDAADADGAAARRPHGRPTPRRPVRHDGRGGTRRGRVRARRRPTPCWSAACRSPRAAGSLLRPRRRADAQDMFLAGLDRRRDRGAAPTSTASTHVAVVLDDDPAADLHDWHGRFWYFAPGRARAAAA